MKPVLIYQHRAVLILHQSLPSDTYKSAQPHFTDIYLDWTSFQTDPQLPILSSYPCKDQFFSLERNPAKLQLASWQINPTLLHPAPPPGYDAGPPPPYHNWQEVVPDTAEFPPPPTSGNYYSNTGNTSVDDAERAHDFCNSTPLYRPVQPPTVVYNSARNYDISPIPPAEFRGSISGHRGRWKGFTRDGNGDCSLLTNIPLYFALADSPFVAEGKKTIYFEVKLLGLRAGPTPNDTSGLSVGFAAQPYPTWRSPGWERGSLAVFSDDGCRFTNDSFGGKDFTDAFRAGETVGIGMSFEIPGDLNSSRGLTASPKLKVNIFFTRNGQHSGGWDLHEEIDEEAGGVEGLGGEVDLYAAVGLFGGVDFEICYHPEGWLYRGD